MSMPPSASPLPSMTMVEHLTPSTAPVTARLVHRMGYRTHHNPVDGHGWEWRHPRHRQNNRWESCPAYAATAEEAWHNLVQDALRREHRLHDDLVHAVLVEAEQQVLHAASLSDPTVPDVASDEQDVAPSSPSRPRARL